MPYWRVAADSTEVISSDRTRQQPASSSLQYQLIPMPSPRQLPLFSVTLLAASLLLPVGEAQAQRRKQLTDEDIINPKKLVLNRVVTYADSFDKTPIGTIFVSKRSILGNPQLGVLGEEGSPRHKQACMLFCPRGTADIDATYVYIIQKKGECTIGVRAIGWSEVKKDLQRQGNSVGIATSGGVRYTGKAINISKILINGKPSGAPLNAKELSKPHGTNYQYFPRNKDWLFALGEQTTASEGFITDIHFFSASNLQRIAQRGNSLTISMPGWQPEKHVISGPELEELRKLTSECDSD
jgi:hypothetical protein